MSAPAPPVPAAVPKAAEPVKPAPLSLPINPPVIKAENAIMKVEDMKPLDASKVLPKEESKSTTKAEEIPKTTTKIQREFFREQISVGVFWGFIISLIWMMNNGKLINWSDYKDPGFACVSWILCWSFVITLNFERASLKNFVVNLYKVIYDPEIPPIVQIEMIKDATKTLTGIAVQLQEALMNKTKIKFFSKKIKEG